MSVGEDDFEARANAAIALIAERIEDAIEDADVEYQDGVLTIELDSGGTFVLNRHRPLRQLWLSSPISGASHYAYEAGDEAWISTRTGGNLHRVLEQDLSQSAGVQVDLGTSTSG